MFVTRRYLPLSVHLMASIPLMWLILTGMYVYPITDTTTETIDSNETRAEVLKQIASDERSDRARTSEVFQFVLGLGKNATISIINVREIAILIRNIECVNFRSFLLTKRPTSAYNS